jgi:hypothetical protein
VVCLLEDPGLEIRLRKAIALCLPQSAFRLDPQQIGFGATLAPGIAVAQMLNRPELSLPLRKRSLEFGIYPVEDCEAGRRKRERERDEQKPRTKGREIVPEPFAKPRRNSAGTR